MEFIAWLMPGEKVQAVCEYLLPLKETQRADDDRGISVFDRTSAN